jgi:ABC-2 type transport system permease protein
MIAFRQTYQVTLRHLRILLRQPAFIVITLIQPLIWLLLFGALFKAVTQIPGFTGKSYIDYLTPGVVVMLAVSSAGWTGMSFIEDMNAGVMDRMLVTPAWRGAFNLGSVAQSMLSVVIQTVLIVMLSLALGAHYENGIGGVLVLLLVAALLAAIFASFSNGLGVLTGQRETLIGAVSSLLLPLTFLSSALMQPSLAPGWIGTVAKYNPVDWAATAARNATTEAFDWGVVAGRVGLLTALLVLAAWFATRAFGVYQRSL